MPFPIEKFERLLTTGTVTLFHWRPDDGWPAESVTQNVENLLGYSADDFVSKRVLFGDLVHPDDLSGLTAAVTAGIASGADWCPHEDYRLKHANGNWIWIRDSTLIERDEEGQLTGFVGYLIDISRLKDTEVALAAQRDRLSLVLEGTRLGMWDWNPQTNEVTFDERWAEMLGYDLCDIEPGLSSWESRVHPQDLASCYADIQAHVEGKTPFYENIHRMKHRDGRWLHILDRGRICEWDAEGKPTRFTGTHTDITAQREAELAAQQASKAKSTFLARMSHEIRTPLNGVLGVLQLLEATDPTAIQSEYLDIVRDSGENLLSIIGDVLDMSKIEAGQMSIAQEPFGVIKTMQSVFDLYCEHALSKDLGYDLVLAPDLPDSALGDPHRIRQVVGNLLSNALKFTEAGSVTMSVGLVEQADDDFTLEVSVADTGVGIQHPEQIWEAFRQDDSSISRRFGGTGLGLSVCRQLTELMAGEIGVSTVIGEGSVFTLCLPLVRVVNTEQPAPVEAPKRGATLPKLRVLVAEDNKVNQLVIMRALKSLGQEPTLVETGVEAVEAFDDAEFDLIFMDLHMPKMNGIEATRRIRNSGHQTKIVALSADAFAVENEAIRAVHFDGILTKPFRFEDLQAEILRAA